MGLDVYAAGVPDPDEWRLGRLDRLAFKRARISLAGGMLSGDHGSFRGKLYSSLVQHVTGESLYQGWIPPDTVKEMSEALDRCDPEQAIATYDGPYMGERTVEDIAELRAFFRVCAKRRLGLVGSW